MAGLEFGKEVQNSPNLEWITCINCPKPAEEDNNPEKQGGGGETPAAEDVAESAGASRD